MKQEKRGGREKKREDPLPMREQIDEGWVIYRTGLLEVQKRPIKPSSFTIIVQPLIYQSDQNQKKGKEKNCLIH